VADYWVYLLNFLLTVLTLLLACHVLLNKGSKALALLFLSISAHSAVVVFHSAELPFLYSERYIMVFLYGPLLYFAIRNSLFPELVWQPYHIIHFIPVVCAYIARSQFDVPMAKVGPVMVTVLLIYIPPSYVLFYRYRRIISKTRSSIPEAFYWLLGGLVLFTVMFVFQLIRYSFKLFDNLAGDQWIALLYQAGANAFFGLLVLKGLHSSNLITGVKEEEAKLSQNLSNSAINSKEIPPQLVPTLNAINRFMEEHKPYLNSELTLTVFAEQLDRDPREVSDSIRSAHSCAFPEFINRARVDEAKRLLEDPIWQERSILDVGLQAGFNSKSSFNLMFKRISSETPTQYRKKLSLNTAI